MHNQYAMGIGVGGGGDVICPPPMLLPWADNSVWHSSRHYYKGRTGQCIFNKTTATPPPCPVISDTSYKTISNSETVRSD